MRNKKTIRLEIETLRLPPLVLRIFDGTESRRELAERCSNPSRCLVDGSGLEDRFLPLWECGITVTAYDKTTAEYCKFSLEDPVHPWFRVTAFGSVVADLLIDLWEDEVPAAVLAEIAAMLEYPRLGRLIASLEEGPMGNYETWRAMLRTNNGGSGETSS